MKSASTTAIPGGRGFYATDESRNKCFGPLIALVAWVVDWSLLWDSRPGIPHHRKAFAPIQTIMLNVAHVLSVKSGHFGTTTNSSRMLSSKSR
jgi:hypothetical protein